MKKKGDKVMEKIYLACYETEVLAAFRNIEDAIDYIVDDVATECRDMDDEATKEELAAELRNTYTYGAWLIQKVNLN